VQVQRQPRAGAHLRVSQEPQGGAAPEARAAEVGVSEGAPQGQGVEATEASWPGATAAQERIG